MYFESWLRKPPQKNRNWGEKVSDKTSFQVYRDGAEKSTEQDRGEKASTLPHYRTMPGPSPAFNAMQLHP